jgi:hypothetical protein
VAHRRLPDPLAAAGDRRRRLQPRKLRHDLGEPGERAPARAPGELHALHQPGVHAEHPRIAVAAREMGVEHVAVLAVEHHLHEVGIQVLLLLVPLVVDGPADRGRGAGNLAGAEGEPALELGGGAVGEEQHELGEIGA